TEQYKNLNSGANPEAGLLKAVVCNTAYDAGKPGPDYRYGFGVLNARRAGLAIENATYFSGSITDGASNSHSIHVPSGTHEVRVMLYWADESGDPTAESILVNDLDLTVSKSGESYEPWVLDPTPGNENENATRGADHLNNIEQVTFEPLSFGSYTINVEGYDVSVGPQNYFIVYEIIQKSIVVTYPFGGESFEPNSSEWLLWDAFGPNRENITVEYSVDGGGSWTALSAYNGSSNNQEYIQMAVPDVHTSKALVRASIDGTAIYDQSDYFFTIASVPTNFSVNSCGGMVHLSWDAVENIAGYEVLMRDTTMEVIKTTTTNSAIIDGLTTGETYWFAVQVKLKDGGSGQHTISQSIEVTASTCSSFEDATVSAVVAPETSGRMHTSTALSSAELVTVSINNLGYQTLTSIPVSYRINSGATITETWTGSLAPGETTDFTFSTKADFSAENTYSIEAWTGLVSDWNASNDDLLEPHVVKQLGNDPVLIPLTAEDFEAAEATLEFSDDMGIAGMDRVDFSTSAAQGRIRTNAGASFTTGDRAITMDAAVDGERILNELILTYNLDGQSHPELYLSFDYMHHSQDDDPDNLVFVRGSDSDAWISVYDLYANQGNAGVYKSSGDIELIGQLAANGQGLSSSFQVRFCQAGSAHAVDQFSESGYTFDNIELSDVSLAVDLIEFEAWAENEQNVQLHWIALFEEDFSHYELQVARGDEAHLNGQFDVIERIEPLGTNPSEYQYLDRNANKGYTLYYRLKMVDLDGSFEYSPVRPVSFGADTNLEMLVFPNPVADKIAFRIKDMPASEGDMYLTDLSGRILMSLNLIHPFDGDFEQEIPLDRHLPNGYYLVRVAMGDEKITKKILRVGGQP
ncbi:MAG: T9SS type A sorting domain-containing protein, partial [Bacteroidota bacterium]